MLSLWDKSEIVVPEGECWVFSEAGVCWVFSEAGVILFKSEE